MAHLLSVHPQDHAGRLAGMPRAKTLPVLTAAAVLLLFRLHRYPFRNKWHEKGNRWTWKGNNGWKKFRITGRAYVNEIHSHSYTDWVIFPNFRRHISLLFDMRYSIPAGRKITLSPIVLEFILRRLFNYALRITGAISASEWRKNINLMMVNKSLENVAKFKYSDRQKLKIASWKKEKSSVWGILATIQFRIFCLTASYLKTQRLKYEKLRCRYYLLFCMGSYIEDFWEAAAQEVTGGWKNRIMRSFIICTPHEILLRW